MITNFPLEPQHVQIKAERDSSDGFYRVHAEGKAILTISPRGDVYFYLDNLPMLFRASVYKDSYAKGIACCDCDKRNNENI